MEAINLNMLRFRVVRVSFYLISGLFSLGNYYRWASNGGLSKWLLQKKFFHRRLIFINFGITNEIFFRIFFFPSFFSFGVRKFLSRAEFNQLSRLPHKSWNTVQSSAIIVSLSLRVATRILAGMQIKIHQQCVRD